MVFWNSLAFLMIQQMLAIWSLVPLPFLNPAWTSGSSWFVLLKPGLEKFEHYFASIWKWSESEVAQSCPTLCDPIDSSPPLTVAQQAPLSMGFSRQEYWSGLPFPSPGDLSDPGIEPQSPTLQTDALTSEPPGKPIEKSMDGSKKKDTYRNTFKLEAIKLSINWSIKWLVPL